MGRTCMGCRGHYCGCPGYGAGSGTQRIWGAVGATLSPLSYGDRPAAPPVLALPYSSSCFPDEWYYVTHFGEIF